MSILNWNKKICLSGSFYSCGLLINVFFCFYRSGREKNVVCLVICKKLFDVRCRFFKLVCCYWILIGVFCKLVFEYSVFRWDVLCCVEILIE